MAYLLKNNAVFLHVPKTGGTYVHQVLKALCLIRGPLGFNHTDFEHTFWHAKLHDDTKVFRYILRDWFGSPHAQLKMKPGCFMFCFVREPLAWYESWWRFMSSIDWRVLGDENDPHRWYPTAMLNGLGSPDFNTFVHNVLRKRPGFVTEMYSWYVRPGVTFVGRTEHLRRDLQRAFKLMQLPFDREIFESIPPQNDASSRPSRGSGSRSISSTGPAPGNCLAPARSEPL